MDILGSGISDPGISLILHNGSQPGAGHVRPAPTWLNTASLPSRHHHQQHILESNILLSRFQCGLSLRGQHLFKHQILLFWLLMSWHLQHIPLFVCCGTFRFSHQRSDKLCIIIAPKSRHFCFFWSAFWCNFTFFCEILIWPGQAFF